MASTGATAAILTCRNWVHFQPTKSANFSLTRESGKVTFKGIFQNHWGHGSYQFVPNPVFKTYLAIKGYRDIDDDLMFSIFIPTSTRRILTI